MADSGNKKELLALCSNSLTYDSPSFANLLKSVLTSNSPPFGFQGQNGQHETSQKDNVGVIKPKVTRVQVKLPTEIAMPNLPMMIHKESPRVVSSDHDTPPSHIAKEQPALDGYSWRKYGQKQVKNSRSSRSYYRCANSSCEAKKKVQHCDISGCVLDIVYMGQHNHGIVQNKRIVARVPVAESAQKVDGKDPCPHSEESRHSSVMVGETEQHSSSSSGGKCEGHNGNKPESEKLFKDAEVRQNPESEPGLRKRSKETSAQLNSVSGANKESRTIVHNSADGAITSDGYRWRKYGQKMVKGSSKSRSYYRCTYAGCTAHKHVERALDDSTDTIITYVRIHNHEMPAPKKQKVSCFPADVTMDSVADGHCKSVKSLSSQPIVTKRSMDAEEVLELGGEEALESARTLLAFSALESN